MDSLNRHEDYGQESLDETHLSDDPIKQFGEWLVEAEENSIYEPNAFIFGVVTKNSSIFSIASKQHPYFFKNDSVASR